MTPTTRNLVRAVADVYGVAPEMVTNGARFCDVISARHACWLIHAERTRNISATAREFGVDHTSITHARKRMRALCETDAREAGLWSEAQFVAAKERPVRGVDPEAFRTAVDKVERALVELKELIEGVKP